jgi:hypothetical protein
MVAMEFQRPVAENAMPIDPAVKSNLSPSDLHRLTRAKSSVFKFERFADLLSPEEMDEKAQEEERRSKVRKLRNSPLLSSPLLSSPLLSFSSFFSTLPFSTIVLVFLFFHKES